MSDAPVQHTPKHLEGDGVFDPRHPAASAFAVAQPAAGVVADDVEDRGQNLGGGPSASQAAGQYSDQREVLAKQHAETLRATSGVVRGPSLTVDDDGARPADDGGSKSESKPSPSKPASGSQPSSGPVAGKPGA